MNSDSKRQDSPASTAADLKEDAKRAAASGAEQVKKEISTTAEELRRQGHDMAGNLKSKAGDFADSQKDAGVEHVYIVARAIDRAAEELERSSPELARYTRKAASSVEDFSESLRDRSATDLLRDVNDYARREPLVFFGGALLAGIALARFLRSSEERTGTSHHAQSHRARRNDEGSHSAKSAHRADGTGSIHPSAGRL